MKNNVREIIKNVIEENVVSFKESTSKTLYTKVANRLQEQYKNVAQSFLRNNNETNNRAN
jgi:hypothetical protein